MDRLHCPICRAELIKKDGKNGEFIGCSSFPMCNYSAFVKDFSKAELDQMMDA